MELNQKLGLAPERFPEELREANAPDMLQLVLQSVGHRLQFSLVHTYTGTDSKKGGTLTNLTRILFDAGLPVSAERLHQSLDPTRHNVEGADLQVTLIEGDEIGVLPKRISVKISELPESCVVVLDPNGTVRAYKPS